MKREIIPAQIRHYVGALYAGEIERLELDVRRHGQLVAALETEIALYEQAKQQLRVMYRIKAGEARQLQALLKVKGVKLTMDGLKYRRKIWDETCELYDKLIGEAK